MEYLGPNISPCRPSVFIKSISYSVKVNAGKFIYLGRTKNSAFNKESSILCKCAKMLKIKYNRFINLSSNLSYFSLPKLLTVFYITEPSVKNSQSIFAVTLNKSVTFDSVSKLPTSKS